MRRVFVLLIAGWVLLAASCAGSPDADWSDLDAKTHVESPAAESQTLWQYPIAPGLWYPGDGPLPEHPFKYYRIRCWPGCHDPNSAPQPHP
jgi:hypothetical protein